MNWKKDLQKPFLNVTWNDRENIKEKIIDKENRKRSSNIYLVDISEEIKEK